MQAVVELSLSLTLPMWCVCVYVCVCVCVDECLCTFCLLMCSVGECHFSLGQGRPFLSELSTTICDSRNNNKDRMLYIVDIQYYRYGHQKLLKEACVMPLLHPGAAKHFAFKAPFPLHDLPQEDIVTANYLYHKLDALHWNEGGNEVKAFISLLSYDAIVLCNGLEKMLYLQSVLPPFCQILNVNVTFSLLPSSSSSCPYRIHKQCAWLRVHQLYSHLSKMI